MDEIYLVLAHTSQKIFRHLAQETGFQNEQHRLPPNSKTEAI
jgi:hypothetical protein